MELNYAAEWSAWDYETVLGAKVTSWTEWNTGLSLLEKEDSTTTWVGSWGRGYYQDYLTVSSSYFGVYTTKSCTECSSTCYECYGSGSSSCTSCPKSSYLSVASTKYTYGACLPKLTTSLVQTIFVDPSSTSTVQTGSYTSPFTYIPTALAYAFSQAASYASSQINIYLLNSGTYVMSRDPAEYVYKQSYKDQYSGSQSVLIQPAFCGETYGSKTFGASDADWINSTQTLTIYYQIGNGYRFMVYRELKFKSLIFDALDSSIDSDSDWLFEGKRWCELSGTTMIDSSQKTGSGTWLIVSRQTEEWVNTIGDSFFQFYYNEDLSTSTSVGTLIIEDCTFQNFFHDFTSLIGLTKGHGFVEISNTIFQRFSNWGSIIRDNRDYPDVTDTESGNYMDLQLRISRAPIEMLEDNYNVEPNSDCQNSLWSDIQITDSTFKDFNYLKPNIDKLYLMGKDNVMKYQGIILNLEKFYGDILIKGNTFDGLQFKYANWEVTQGSNTFNASSLWGQDDVTQLKALFKIDLYSNVQFVSNTFNGCNSYSGLIVIKKYSNDAGLLIHSNTFTQNSALTVANLVRIDISTSLGYDQAISTYMPCAGVQISGNTFKNNIGWSSTVGLIAGYWFSETEMTNMESVKELFSSPDPMDDDPDLNIQKESVSSFSTVNNVTLNEGLTTMDLNKYKLIDNVYDQNFIGLTTSLISVHNIRAVYFENEEYSDNQGHYLEALSAYGSISSGGNLDSNNIPGAASFANYFLTDEGISALDDNAKENYYAGAPISIDGSLLVDIKNITFDNNYKQEYSDNTSYDVCLPSQAITFRRCNGKITINGMTVKNLKGLDSSVIKPILDSAGSNSSNLLTHPPNERSTSTGDPTSTVTSPNYSIDYGFKTSIIVFQSPSSDSSTNFQNYISTLSITSLTLSNLTFYKVDSETAVFAYFPTSINSVSLSSVSLENINLPLNDMSIFQFSNKGSLTISNLTATGIESTSYSYDTSTYSYVSATSPLMTFTSFEKDTNISSPLLWTVSDITISDSYGKEGTVMSIESTDIDVDNFHEISLTVTGLSATGIRSYEGAAVLVNLESFDIKFTDWTFEGNYGIAGPADFMIEEFKGLVIEDSIIKGFETTTGYTQSMEFSMKGVFTYIPIMRNVTFQCNEDSVFSDIDYRSLVSSGSTLTSKRPIYLNNAILKTESSTLKNCKNSLRGGVLYVGDSSQYSDESSTFTQNAAISGGAIYVEKGTITFSGTSFISNYAQDGGALSMNSESTVGSITSTSFTSNYASSQGGAVEVLSSSTLSITSATFSLNESPDSSWIYALGTSNTNVVNGTTFEDNKATTGRTVSWLFADAKIYNSTFKDNSSTKETEGIFVTFSTVEIEDTTFENTESMYGNDSASSLQVPGGFIYVSVGVTITIKSWTFTKGNAYSGGAIYMSGNSIIYLSYSTFTDNYSYNYGGSIYLSNYDNIEISNSEFALGISTSLGSEIYSEAGTLTISSCNFTIKSISVAVYLKSTTFSGAGLIITNYDTSNTVKTSNEGGAIYSSDSPSFTLEDSTISDINFATLGGAVFIETETQTSIPASASHKISNVTFSNNTAYYGGALYVKEVDYLEISNSTLTGNIANSTSGTEGNGGALYYSSTTINSQVVFSSSCSISSNEAQVAGGGLFWNYNQPINISLVTFTDNSAEKYGNDYACFAQKIIRIDEDEYTANKNTVRRRLEGTLDGADSISLTYQQSGSSLPTIYLALVDEFGQYVGSDSTSTATIGIESSTSNETYTPVLSGTVSQTAINGMYKFSDLKFTAEPGRTFELSFSTNGIDSSTPSNAAYLLSKGTTSTDIEFSISLRECILGETFTDSGAWEECEEDLYYYLSTMSTPGSWKEWQTSKMYWKGGSDVGPKPGYWRSSNTSDNFISCLYSSACLGYVYPDYNNLGEWFTGYDGVLCSEWEIGYSRTGTYEWSKWPDPVWNIIQIILILMAVILGIAIMVRSTLAGALQRKNIQSVYIKLLMNHLQLILLTASFDFDWPSKVTKLFSTTEPVAQVSSQILSFDCFLDTRSDNDSSPTIRLFYQKMIMYALLPIILASGSSTFWYIYYCIKKKEAALKRSGRIMASTIILFFLIHPSIVQYMFSNFNWLTIDNEQRVYDDLEIVWWQTEHINYSLMIAIPSIIVWGFGIPLFAWIILSRHKNQLEVIDTREKYGFLYNGYKKNYYFWESINMYRKITMIFISVFLKLAGVITQALVVFLVLIIFLILNIKLLPFTFKSLNDMEMLSFLTSMLTIYCGLFYLSNMPEVYNSTDEAVKAADNGLRLNEASNWLLFLIILLCNIAFIVYWWLKMLKEIENTLRSKFEKAYLIIWLWGNKYKLMEEKRKREEQDENEILKEQFDNQLEGLRGLYSEGKLVLNRVNIEKSEAYLNREKYLKQIEGQKKQTEEQTRKKERFRRLKETEFMSKLMNENDEDSSNIETNKNKHRYNLYEESKVLFESDLDNFLGLSKKDEESLKQLRSHVDKAKSDFEMIRSQENYFSYSKSGGIVVIGEENNKINERPEHEEMNSIDISKETSFLVNTTSQELRDNTQGRLTDDHTTPDGTAKNIRNIQKSNENYDLENIFKVSRMEKVKAKKMITKGNYYLTNFEYRSWRVGCFCRRRWMQNSR
jgi:predicted outer membrane repeat protein